MSFFSILTKKFDLNVTILFDKNGGDSVSFEKKTYTIGLSYDTLPTASKSGMFFRDWYTDPIEGTKITAESIVDGINKLLYAHYGEFTNYTAFEVKTTESNKEFGFYLLTKKEDSEFIYIDWGDGQIERFTAYSLSYHTYSTVGTFIVKISDDISDLRMHGYESSQQLYTYNKYTLTKILRISSSITTIPELSFYECYNLLECPELSGITYIGKNAFWMCKSLSSEIKLPDILNIDTGYNPFTHCYSLSSIEVGDDSNFSLIDENGNRGKRGIVLLDDINHSVVWGSVPCCISVVIPDDIKTIGNYAFIYCSDLTYIDLPKVESTLEYSFGACLKLSAVNVPNVLTLGFATFECCTALTSISMPNATEIGDCAFISCVNLQVISCGSVTAPEVYLLTFAAADLRFSSCTGGNYRYDGTNRLYVYKPLNYQTSYWKSILFVKDYCGYTAKALEPYSLMYSDIAGLSSKYEYTGEEIIPEISVFNPDSLLLNASEYDYLLENNTECGIASLSVVGKDPYYGILTGLFKIYDPEAQTWTADLNGQWRIPLMWINTDKRFTVYESNSNYNIGNGYAKMYIDVDGYEEFTIYVNSYAESNYDYSLAFNEDVDISLLPSYTTTGVKQSTYGYQFNPSLYVIDSGTGWKKVTYSLDGQLHRIMICYRKDSSVNNNWDRGYVAIPNIINEHDLTYGTMTGLSSYYLSTGHEIIPDISVYSYSGKLLAENIEWSKVLSNNIDVGTAGISAVGISPYYGVIAKTFRIKGEGPEYTELEYIQSSGTQYIDTGIVPNINTKAELKMALESILTVLDWYVWLGSQSYDDSSNTWQLRTAGNLLNRMSPRVFNYNPIAGGLVIDSPYDFNIYTLKNGEYSINSMIYSGSASSPVSTTLSLYLFGINKNGSVWSDRMTCMKVGYLKLYESDLLVRDMISVKDPDGTVCMYDRVSETYLYNKGTGDFIAGPEK